MSATLAGNIPFASWSERIKKQCSIGDTIVCSHAGPCCSLHSRTHPTQRGRLRGSWLTSSVLKAARYVLILLWWYQLLKTHVKRSRNSPLVSGDELGERGGNLGAAEDGAGLQRGQHASGRGPAARSSIPSARQGRRPGAQRGGHAGPGRPAAGARAEGPARHAAAGCRGVRGGGALALRIRCPARPLSPPHAHDRMPAAGAFSGHGQ